MSGARVRGSVKGWILVGWGIDLGVFSVRGWREDRWEGVVGVRFGLGKAGVEREDTNLELVLPRFSCWGWVEEIDCKNLSC